MRIIKGVLGAAILSLTLSHALAEEPLWIEGAQNNPPIELNLPSFAPVVEKLGEAVVNIAIEGEDRPERDLSGRKVPGWPFEFPPDAGPQGGKRAFSSLGSGFVIHPDGFIVTNNHVIEKAKKILVTFRDDKKSYDAKVIGADEKSDLALIRVDVGRRLSAVVLGDSDRLRPGDWVIAVGNPFRFGHSATVGIVSAKSRRVPGSGPYGDFIQTDASINPGNSGGPLFNARGEVVGINTAIYSPGRFGLGSGFNIGIGFATPINLIKGVLPQLREKGKVIRGWLGVLIQPVSADVAEALKLDRPSGALVADVLPDSPASGAGFKRGDVIISFDGKPVEENSELPLMVAETPIGKSVAVEVVRGSKAVSIQVAIAELKEQGEDRVVQETEQSQLGLIVQDLTADMAKGLGLENTDGVIVTSVAPDSPASKSDLRRGDIIIEVGGKPVNSTVEFREVTKDFVEKKPVLFLVKRGDTTLFLTLKVE